MPPVATLHLRGTRCFWHRAGGGAPFCQQRVGIIIGSGLGDAGGGIGSSAFESSAGVGIAFTTVFDFSSVLLAGPLGLVSMAMANSVVPSQVEATAREVVREQLGGRLVSAQWALRL